MKNFIILRVEASEILEVNIKKELSYVGLEKAIMKIEVELTDEIECKRIMMKFNF